MWYAGDRRLPIEDRTVRSGQTVANGSARDNNTSGNAGAKSQSV
ncbi:hypothetical protein CKA32_004569 [Geitlerinema sp. FC II]|nr:hypothetical protein [Geitlerinema sp. CS-897]PPT07496.1 hypothetical protein CKA32_004569 [Geitlerinema sp. FC II]